MVQNRNKLIKLLIGNLSNSIVHSILEKSLIDELHASRYREESLNSLTLARKYRDKINPTSESLPNKDIQDIRSAIKQKVNLELNLRIKKGYTNISINLIDQELEITLKKLKVSP